MYSTLMADRPDQDPRPDQGNSYQRREQRPKAMCEAMIKEILVIADDTVRPIFKLPITGDDEGLAVNGPALSDSEHAVRALPTMVGDTGIEPVTSSV